jgi:hypothetical protein
MGIAIMKNTTTKISKIIRKTVPQVRDEVEGQPRGEWN